MAAEPHETSRERWLGHTRIVPKPWGHELIFADVPGAFSGKELHVRAGESLSLQYHVEKEEVIAVREGRVLIEVGHSADALERVELGVGDSIHITPGIIHRTNAIEDSILLEASTYHPDDVVRLTDSYGRQGTTSA
jgi:mannose-6-phosphate isomerase-like protein (cupin superfamily)